MLWALILDLIKEWGKLLLNKIYSILGNKYLVYSRLYWDGPWMKTWPFGDIPAFPSSSPLASSTCISK
jgi:hypothetical protein